MQDLVVTIVQDDILWQQPAANRARFAAVLQSECSNSDLVILPETFTTGFDLESATQAEDMQGETVQWLREQAAAIDAHICGSVMIREGEQRFNRLVWATPEGQIYHYDKRHLFSFAGEDKHYSRGEQRLIVDCRGWRCCPLICYDLRFPVWSRNRQDYDLLIYVANWPKKRIRHWSSLLTARAIENLSYTAGCNRIGEDGNGQLHNGQSAILDPKGKPLVEPGSRAGSFTVSLDYEQMQRYRERFAALADADDFVIR